MIQELLEKVKAGDKLDLPQLVEGVPMQNVQLHCTSATETTRVFSGYCRGVRIGEFKASKENGKWVPR